MLQVCKFRNSLVTLVDQTIFELYCLLKMVADLSKFIAAQQRDFPSALAEIKSGRKRSHWMWYIFPQLAGLGFTETSKFYAIRDLAEAEAFLQHPILGKNLIEISNALLHLKTKDAHEIFGSPDELKLRSSMTLFSETTNADPVFDKVLVKFYNGIKDEKTLNLL